MTRYNNVETKKQNICKISENKEDQNKENKYGNREK